MMQRRHFLQILGTTVVILSPLSGCIKEDTPGNRLRDIAQQSLKSLPKPTIAWLNEIAVSYQSLFPNHSSDLFIQQFGHVTSTKDIITQFETLRQQQIQEAQLLTVDGWHLVPVEAQWLLFLNQVNVKNA